MRLSKKICELIKSSAIETFGNTNVYLFGSRTDDTKLGGDIDIAIESNLTKNEFRKNKIKLISSLIKKGFELKIDIVNYPKDNSLLAKEIDKNKILL